MSLDLFREQFPEFSGVPDADIGKYIVLAEGIHTACPMATVYLAAHLLTVLTADNVGVAGSGGANVDGGGSAREVMSETANKVSTTFAGMSTGKAGDSYFTSTAYGRMYIVLRDSCVAGKFSVRVE